MDILQNSSLHITVAVIIVFALVKIIEFLASKLMQEKSVLTSQEQRHLEEVHQLVTAKDNDGMPLFYVPRSWATLQKSMLEKMEKITRHQERTAYMMDTIVNMLDKISEREKK